jgi:Family of unknown function (DUF6049)
LGGAFSYAAGMNPIIRARSRRVPAGLPPLSRLALCSFFVVALAIGPGLAGGAGAQEPPVASAQLVAQQIHTNLGGSLGARVRVTNRSDVPLANLGLQVGFFERVDNRTVLHEAFDGNLEQSSPFAVTNHQVDGELGPGESTFVEVDPSLAANLPSTLEGVYPFTVKLFSGPDRVTPLSAFTSAVILYPEPPEVPLNFTLVVPLISPPARGPTGAFAANEDGVRPLDEALADEGWIRGVVEGLASATEAGLRVGVAPSPRVLAEIGDMANGYSVLEGEAVERVERDSAASTDAAEVLDQLRALFEQPGVQPLLSAYSNPDLPTLLREVDLDHLTEQLSAGETTLNRLLPSATFRQNWLFATGARWDFQTLEQVRRSRYSAEENFRTFVGAEFMDPPINDTIQTCPDPGVEEDAAHSFTCPVSLETESGPTQAYVRDPDLQARFTDLAEPGGDALDLQRLFAESAFIHFQYPGVPQRVVNAIVPAHWEPRPFIMKRLLNGLARAPWLDSHTPAEGFSHVTRPREWSLIERASDLSQTLDYEALPEVERMIDTYAELGPPQDRINSLESNLLTSMSRSWLGAPESVVTGNSYINDSREEIESEFKKFVISGPDTTLTSQQSAIEVNVFNEADYPVTVDVDFQDQNGDIRIAESDQQDLDDITVEPGAAPAIKVDAIADSSGIFNLEARILSPENGNPINSSRISIRSTNFNQIALGITFGALAFLILFYIFRLLRRRRAAGRTAEGSAT